MSTTPTTSTSLAVNSDRISWLAYLGLGLAAAILGIFTSIGVWLFNQAFNAIHNLTFNTIGGALQPIGAWTIALIPAVGGILVALIMKFGTKPDKLAAMAHIIDGVTEHGGRLNIHNGVTFIIASALGIGVGAPVGADTPSAMIGAASGFMVRAALPPARVVHSRVGRGRRGRGHFGHLLRAVRRHLLRVRDRAGRLWRRDLRRADVDRDGDVRHG